MMCHAPTTASVAASVSQDRNADNVEPLIKALADDCIFESQMVLQPLKGKPDIEEYLRGKFETFRKSKTHIACSLARVGSCPVLTAVGKPCVVMHQGGLGAVVLLQHAVDGKIKRVDLCVVSTPEDTRPLN